MEMIELYRDRGIVIYHQDHILAIYCAPCNRKLSEMDRLRTFRCTDCGNTYLRSYNRFLAGWYGSEVRFTKTSEAELEDWVQVWLSGRGVSGVRVYIEW